MTCLTALFGRRRPQPSARFVCRPQGTARPPAPIPASDLAPEWFRRLSADERSAFADIGSLTVGRSLPPLDALTLGHLLAMPASLGIRITQGAIAITGEGEALGARVEHGLAGLPGGPRPFLRIPTGWWIEAPPGWRGLILAPLHRAHPAFDVMATVIAPDGRARPIEACLVPRADGEHRLEAGTPLVQTIPLGAEPALLPHEAA